MARGDIPDNAKGKLVDTWHYQYRGIQEPASADEDEAAPARPPVVKEKKVAVELRLMKQFADAEAPPQPVKKVWFRLVCSEADISLEGSDVESLRTAMWEKLDVKYEIRWFDYYLVELHPDRVYDGIGTAMTFRWTRVEKGIAWDGTELLREDRHKSWERVRPWPGEFRNKQGRVIACIPATKLNEKALLEFRARLDLMREKVAQFLEPATIMKTLANMSQNNLLPPLTGEQPKETEDAEEEREEGSGSEVNGESHNHDPEG